MVRAVEDDIINGVIDFITTLADHHPETEGMFVIRKYQDGPRPTLTTSDTSCDNYATSTFAEISIDRVSEYNTCKSYRYDKEGRQEEVSCKTYDVLIRLEFFGCNALDVTFLILDAIELIGLRTKSLPDNLYYVSHEDAIDTTALEETTHNKRYNFDLNMQYVSETINVLPPIQLSCCMKEFLGINKRNDNKITREL